MDSDWLKTSQLASTANFATVLSSTCNHSKELQVQGRSLYSISFCFTEQLGMTVQSRGARLLLDRHREGRHSRGDVSPPRVTIMIARAWSTCEKSRTRKSMTYPHSRYHLTVVARPSAKGVF
jgi:hypothetical protein